MPRLVFFNVLYESLNVNEYGLVIGLSDSLSGVPKAGLNADNRSTKATNCLFCVVSALSLYNDSKHLK